ncbi:hypothetical protein BH10CHL1_BH10CHL1_40070 [soil metagenome]
MFLLSKKSRFAVMNLLSSNSRNRTMTNQGYKNLLSHIVSVYDSRLIRTYCKIRFSIININILNILALSLRGKRQVLDIGCGFGLFGCYFSSLYPEISYYGIDLDQKRVDMANQAAKRLGLKNASFHCGDARTLMLEKQFDAIMMIDLLHHIDESAKEKLLATCASQLVTDGRLIIKDVTTHPFKEILFTWLLDVFMTRGLDMWYWNEEQFHKALGAHFGRIDTFSVADWMPYPHIVYLCENLSTTPYATKLDEAI